MRVRPTVVPMPAAGQLGPQDALHLDDHAVVLVLELLQDVLVALQPVGQQRNLIVAAAVALGVLDQQFSLLDRVAAEATPDDDGVALLRRFLRRGLLRRQRHGEEKKRGDRRDNSHGRVPGTFVQVPTQDRPLQGGGSSENGWAHPSPWRNRRWLRHTLNSRHSPIPGIGCTPRSSNGRPASPTMSRTVRETRASPAAAR